MNRIINTNNLEVITRMELPFLGGAGTKMMVIDNSGVVSAQSIPNSSVSWTDVTGKPTTFAPSAHTHPAADVTGLSTVAYSGSWNDILNRPSTFTPTGHTHFFDDIIGLATVATSGQYSDLSGKPTIPAQVNLIQGTNITISGTYPNLTISAAGGGGGGIANYYESFTDGTNVATPSGTDMFKFRSGNNLLSVIVSSNDENHGDNVLLTVNQSNLSIGQNQVLGLTTTLGTKIDKNNPITSGTACKIMYDSNGLVVGGTTLVEADIPALSASKITSGSFNSARLASGTATEGYIIKIVSGVPTWSTAPSGGGGGTFYFSSLDFAGDPTSSANPLRLANGNGFTDPGSNGLMARTSANTLVPRTITGTTGRIIISNGDGVAGHPTINIGSEVATTNSAQTFSALKTFSVTPKISTLASSGVRMATILADGTIGAQAISTAGWSQEIAFLNSTSPTQIGNMVYIPVNTHGMIDIRVRAYDTINNKTMVASHIINYSKLSAETSLTAVLGASYAYNNNHSSAPELTLSTTTTGYIKFLGKSPVGNSINWTIDYMFFPGNSGV